MSCLPLPFHQHLSWAPSLLPGPRPTGTILAKPMSVEVQLWVRGCVGLPGESCGLSSVLA